MIFSIFFTTTSGCISSFNPRRNIQYNEYSSEDLINTLESLQFKHKGIVKSEDQFVWKSQPCAYLEPENVTVVKNAWIVTKKFNYLYKRNMDGKLEAPPIGMRSAVPLGGISTGKTSTPHIE